MNLRIAFGLAVLLTASFTASASHAAGWNPVGAPVCEDPNGQATPQICPDGTGGAFVAWRDSRNGNATTDIFVQRLRADGTPAPSWPADGVPVCTAAHTQFVPLVTADGSGGAFVAWQDFRSNTDWDLYATHVTASGAIVAGWPVNGAAVCSHSGTQQIATLLENNEVEALASIAGDGAHGAFVVWEDLRSAPTQVYVQHLVSAGVDPAWPADGMPIAPTAFAQKEPVIATASPGGAFVAWLDSRNGNVDVFAARLQSDGSLPWGVAGVGVCAHPGSQRELSLVGTTGGDAIVGWTDPNAPDTYTDLWAQRLRGSDGTPAWRTDGVIVCNAARTQSHGAMCADALDGAYLTWEDSRSAGNADVYLTRLSSNGSPSPGWPAQGIGIANSADAEVTPRIVPDGSGGVLVAWEDDIGGGLYGVGVQECSRTVRDARASRLRGFSLTLGYSAKAPVACTDEAGGMIVAWRDRLIDAGGDIEAQRVNGTGIPLAVAPTGPGSRVLGLGAAVPNPARQSVSIRFDLARSAPIDAAVYDLDGRFIRRLSEGSTFSAGAHDLAWDLARSSGGRVSPGVYFIRVSSREAVATAKILVVN